MPRSRKLLLCLLGLYAAYGAVVPHVAHRADDERAAGFLLGFPTAIALFTWCKLNAAERQIVAPSAAPMLVGGLAPVGIPFYFFRTLPLGAALLAIGKAVLFYCALMIAYAVARLLSSWLAV
jgi:hypothetical protein